MKGSGRINWELGLTGFSNKEVSGHLQFGSQLSCPNDWVVVLTGWSYRGDSTVQRIQELPGGTLQVCC